MSIFIAPPIQEKQSNYDNWCLDQIKSRLVKRYLVPNFDGTFDYKHDLDLAYCKFNSFKIFEKLGIRFKKIHGNLICDSCNLSSMENFPEIIEGNLYAIGNNLTSFNCKTPVTVNGSMKISYNKITSLRNIPICKNEICLCGNKITSVEHIPKCDIIDLSYNKIEDWSHTPLTVNWINITCNPNLLCPIHMDDCYIMLNYDLKSNSYKIKYMPFDLNPFEGIL